MSGRVQRAVRWLLASLLLQGCSLVGGRPAAPPPPSSSPPSAATAGEVAQGWTQTGVASWYGEPYHGRPTASGEVYDMEAATGAHPTLPFGTRIRVENLDNGRNAVLTINDRGPFKKDRILDVSRRIARELGMLGPGTARVRITVVEVGGWRPESASRLYLFTGWR